MSAISLDAGAREDLRAEIRGTAAARRLHRLHAVLLVAGGLSCRRVARLLGDSSRSVEYWVQRYKRDKSNGLKDKVRPGRPPLLSPEQVSQLEAAVASSLPPAGEARRSWTGAALSRFVASRWGVRLGVRQAQLLLARMRRVG